MAAKGDSGIVVLVAEAEEVVGRWRDRYDGAAARGHARAHHAAVPVPARGPARRRRDRAAPDDLRSDGAVDLELSETARFPETIYLAPDPPDPFRRLTRAIAAEWPEAPPYGGDYADVMPHLTIADSVGDDLMDEIDDDVRPRLPLHTRVTEAHLLVFDGATWQPRERLPFAG